MAALVCTVMRAARRAKVPPKCTLTGMDEIPTPDDLGELRTVMVRTSRYVFEALRGADGVLTTTYTAIAETPDQSAGAREPEEF